MPVGVLCCRTVSLCACLLSVAWTTRASAIDYPAFVHSLSGAIAAKYYDPHLHGADWPALTRRYEAAARKTRTDAQFEQFATEMLAYLQSSHVYVHPSGSSADGWRPAFKTPEIGGVRTVVEVPELADARAQGVRPGDVLLNYPSLAGVLGTRAEVELRDCSDFKHSASALGEAAFWPPPEPGFPWRRLRTAPGTTLGYLQVDAVDDDGAELADKAMADLGDTDGLVIDLRANHGGNASAVRLASYFVGAAGPSMILLEAGIWAPDGADYDDKAISPQVTVALARGDLCAGRDRQLEAALELLRSRAVTGTKP